MALNSIQKAHRLKTLKIKHLFRVSRLWEHEHSIRSPLCWLNSILLVIGTLVILWVILSPLRLLTRMRYQSRRNESFTPGSAARANPSVTITQTDADGELRNYYTGPMSITTSKPPDGETIGDVRRRLKNKFHEKEDKMRRKVSWNPSDASSSVSTLVNNEHSADGEVQHSGLIELKPKGQKRNFFDPDTGELLHLSPWKSRKQSQESEESDESLDEGEVHKMITQMGVGSAVLGGGTAAEEQLHKKAQAESENRPQQMGDSLAGLVTNDEFSAKDALLGKHNHD
ncbi:MAG: hypothetical protein Q9191_006180 [Dirinaria sp. TL-2023a]